MGQLAEIKKILEQLKPELAHKFNVQTIGLFGSVVRNDFSSSSDIGVAHQVQTEGVNISFVKG